MHEAQTVFALVAHSVLCLRFSWYCLFLKSTETTVFSIFFGSVSHGRGLWEPEDVAGVYSPTWVGAWEFWKRNWLEMKNRREWWKREILEEGLGNYTMLSFLINELKYKGQVLIRWGFSHFCLFVLQLVNLNLWLKSENYAYILFL